MAAIAAERSAVVTAEFVEVESGCKIDRPQLATDLAQVRTDKAVIAVAKIGRLARDAGFVPKLANDAKKTGLAASSFAAYRTSTQPSAPVEWYSR